MPHVPATDLLALLRLGELTLILVTLAPQLSEPALEEEFLYEDAMLLVAGQQPPVLAAPPSIKALLAASWVLPRPPDRCGCASRRPSPAAASRHLRSRWKPGRRR